MDTVELSRRLENMIRLGTVAAVDHVKALCRVDSGGLLTDWLPWFERRAGQTRTWDPPTVGEQVLVLSPSGEPAGGLVLVGLYRAAHPAPDNSPDTHVIDFPDGAHIVYDHVAGALTASGIQTARIEAAVSVTIDTPYTHITGQLEVDELITYHAGIAGQGGGHGTLITGDIVQTGGVVSSNGIVLDSHTHTGVQPGGGSSGAPQ